MRRFLFAIPMIVSVAFLCSEASAATISIKQTISKSKLAGICAANGGSSYQSYSGGGYGCTKNNCDKKGGACNVECDPKGKCTGTTPSRVASGVTADFILGKYGARLSAASGNAPACPGGGTEKCTITCTGLFPPVCTSGPPCTCTLDGKVTGTNAVLTRDPGPTKPPRPPGGSRQPTNILEGGAFPAGGGPAPTGAPTAPAAPAPGKIL